MRTALLLGGRRCRLPLSAWPTAQFCRRALLAALVLLAVAGCGGGDQAREPSASAPASTRASTPAASTDSSPDSGVAAPSHPATRSSEPAAPPSSTNPGPTATAPTAPGFPASLAGQDIERIPTRSKIIALTFDAGANADAVGSILATLADEHVAGTFFLTGDFVTEFPDQARRIAAAGHRLGNHSVDHPHFTALTTTEIRAQVLDAEQTISTVAGRNPAPLFRFPYGDRDPPTISAVNALGYVAVRWTVDSLGWQGRMDGARSASFVADRVLAAATPGGIVLMHVGSHPTDHSMLDADALPAIIAGLRQQGYGFVTLDALLTGDATS